MFKKTKALLCSLVVLGGLGLVACQQTDNGDDFEQNSSHFESPVEEMYIIGSAWNSWGVNTIKEANPSCEFKKVSSTEYTYDAVVTADMVKDDAKVEFKFIASNSWSVQYGMEDVDFDACNKAFKDLFPGKKKEDWKKDSSDRSNIEVTAAGTYHVKYNPFNFRQDDAGLGLSYKFTIDFTAAAPAA